MLRAFSRLLERSSAGVVGPARRSFLDSPSASPALTSRASSAASQHFRQLSRMAHCVDADAITEAAARIKPYVHYTPASPAYVSFIAKGDRLNHKYSGGYIILQVMTCSTLNTLSGHDLFFKCEIFQKSGAFKIRGACNAVMSLQEEEAAKGVVTHSSGNHGGAVALAAKLRGVSSTVVVPEGTPKCKIEAIQGYGGTVVVCEPTMDGREQICAQLQRETGATFLHPYNDPRVIAGQGTMALEFLEQVEGMEAIVVPVSGGGMISGIAVAAKAKNPDIRIIAAEPLGTNDAADTKKCKEVGELVACERPKTIADGLQGRLGSNTWPIVRDLVDAVVTVTEQEIFSAMQLCYERMKVVVEPSGAVGVAAVLSAGFPSEGRQKIGVILCGGNVDLAAKGLWTCWGT